MNIQSQILKIEDGVEFLHKQNLLDIVKNHSYLESLWFLFFAKFPSVEEIQILEKILILSFDHGEGTASAMGARISASTKNSLHASLAAGILCFGERHGIAGSATMKFIKKYRENENLEELCRKLKEEKTIIPGIGHKVLKVDERAEFLLDFAKQKLEKTPNIDFFKNLVGAYNRIFGKELPINIDGTIGVILLDLGVEDEKMAEVFFISARVNGLMAHIVEEINNDNGLLRL
jgi:ATP-citrate lyase alpha-subunit